MRVVVGEEFNRKTLTEQLSDLSSPVTPLVVIDDIVIRPQRLKRGHCEGQESTGTDDPAQLRDSPFVIIDMFNNVETGHNIERAVWVWKVFESSASQQPFFSHLAKFKRHRFVVDAKSLPISGKMLQRDSRPAPRIEHSMLHFRIIQKFGDQLKDDAPPGDEPPVVMLKSEILSVVVDVHPDNIARGQRKGLEYPLSRTATFSSSIWPEQVLPEAESGTLSRLFFIIRIIWRKKCCKRNTALA